jgi:CBS domain-containing protein
MPEESYFEEVGELLADREISGLPVVDAASRVVGVVSERDLAHALGGPLIRLVLRRPLHGGPFQREAHALSLGAKRAKDIMTSPAIVAYPDTPLSRLAQIMLEQQINRIPIVHQGHLVGLVTRGDLLGTIAGVTHREVAMDQPPLVMGSGLLDGNVRKSTPDLSKGGMR